MPSIEMLILPTPVNRAALRGFWLSISVLAGLIIAATLALVGWRSGASRAWVGLVTGLVVALPGLVRPSIIWFPYRTWNWLVRRFSVFAIAVVTAACYRFVMIVLSRISDPRQFETSPSGSTWRSRTTQAPSSYSSTHDHSSADSMNWRRDIAEWRRDSGYRWSWALVPFIALIRWLDVEPSEARNRPSDIYTLY
jgi:hypothetical protein